jgi:hypothetical protein
MFTWARSSEAHLPLLRPSLPQTSSRENGWPTCKPNTGPMRPPRRASLQMDRGHGQERSRQACSLLPAPCSLLPLSSPPSPSAHTHDGVDVARRVSSINSHRLGFHHITAPSSSWSRTGLWGASTIQSGADGHQGHSRDPRRRWDSVTCTAAFARQVAVQFSVQR